MQNDIEIIKQENAMLRKQVRLSHQKITKIQTENDNIQSELQNSIAELESEIQFIKKQSKAFQDEITKILVSARSYFGLPFRSSQE